MAENDKTKTLVCEQCGAPLPELGEDVGCINCLLRSGFEELAAQSPDDAPSRLFQHYEILLRPDDSLWELGRGSIGITYKAQDVALGTTVALKVLNPLFPIAPERRRIFLRQLQVAAHLHHPNVAGIFHLGIINPAASDETSTAGATAPAGGECFYTMEFVEGESLEARVRRTGPLAPTLALQVGLQAAQALNAAENIGLVQRTIAPADLFLTTEPDPGGPLETNMPSVKVIDFGLSKLCRENQAAEPRADVRSLGEILWFALTGTRLELPPGEKLSTSPLRRRRVPPSVIALLDSIFSPRGETAGIAQITERLQRCLTSARTQRFSASRYACAAGAAAVLIALVFFVIPAPASREKSIAVLPFRNLSQDPADAFFAEGVQDDILSRLVKVHDLKVISRLGAQHYPAEQARDFRAIGHELGVRHLLEGSLRRSGEQVYVTVALIDTRDGRRVWSENYTRKPADATQIEGTLAADIADALGSKLSEPERQVLVANSTHNPDAYVLYLQGRKLEKNVTIAISAYEAAQALYQQAVTLDPRFALAHAHLTGGSFDLPAVGEFCDEYFASRGLCDRLKFFSGDFFKDELPKADVLLMGHVLTNWNLEEKRLLISKAYAALPPGGALLVYDPLIDEDRSTNAFGLLHSLNMLLVTSGGFAYTGFECSSWMRDAGFHDIRVEELTAAESMVVGIKPDHLK